MKCKYLIQQLIVHRTWGHLERHLSTSVQSAGCEYFLQSYFPTWSSKWVLQHVHCNLHVTSDTRWKAILPHSFVEFTDDSCCCIIRGTVQIISCESPSIHPWTTILHLEKNHQVPVNPSTQCSTSVAMNHNCYSSYLINLWFPSIQWSPSLWKPSSARPPSVWKPSFQQPPSVWKRPSVLKPFPYSTPAK